MPETICIVDDHLETREALVDILTRQGYEALPAANGAEFLEILKNNELDLVLADLILPDVSGLELLRKCQEVDTELQVIMVTGYGTVETAVEAMREGAFHYLAKPVKPAELKALVKKALSVRQLALENKSLRTRIGEKFAFENIIGSGASMERVFELVGRVAPTKSIVLISGESGTGKEVIANCLHENSRRSRGPYIKVNCAAIVETLLESELFGHVKGSFTGAVRDKKGKFQAAHGGTIFLDEIGEMSLTTQTKLLRVLQESEVERVGAVGPEKVDVRVLAATNKDLQEQVEKGLFREDLYYRLKVVTINLPPLRDRRQDIPLFVERFLEEFNKTHGRNVKKLTPAAMDVLRRYHWPGNVRELRNLIEGAIVTSAEDTIDVDTLPADIMIALEKGQPFGVPVGMTLEEVETEMIKKTLDMTEGNRTKAAKILGVSLRTLQRKLKTMNEDGELAKGPEPV